MAGQAVTIPLDMSTLLMFAITSVVAYVINNMRQEKDRLIKRLDDLEKRAVEIDKQTASAVKDGTKPLWDKLDTVETKLIGPLAASIADVAKSVTAFSAEFKAAMSDLKVQMIQTHPTKAEFTAMKADLDRIAERLVPPELLETKQLNRRQR